jgi:hypothetical protein
VTNFYQQATALLQSNPKLNVEFILDGAATPGGSPRRHCLDHLWPSWNSTWIFTSDPFEAFYSNKDSDGSIRFQIFNIPGPVEVLDLLADLDYGKFSSGQYPYLYWEPSDQAPILRVAASYNRHKPNPHGFRFAINIDPIHFTVFSASQSHNAWNIPLTSNNHYNPRIGVIPNQNAFLLFYSDANSRFKIISFLFFSYLNPSKSEFIFTSSICFVL